MSRRATLTAHREPAAATGAQTQAEVGTPAARLLVMAAERARREGEAGRAVELCLRAAHSDPRADGLQRIWGLALLAWGDPDGARGHLERWCEEEPESVDALLWTLEASWRRHPTLDIGPLLERLAQGLGGTGAASPAGLRERVRSHLQCGEAPPGGLAAVPFWEAEEFPWTLCRGRSRRADPEPPRRRVLVVEDGGFSARPLSEILERWSLDVVPLSGDGDGSAADDETPAQLAIVPLPDGEAAAERLRRIRSHPRLAEVPILGVVTLAGSPLDCDGFRELGVIGVVDRGATPEQIAFRVGQAVLRPAGRACGQIRVPVDLPVELEAEGRATEERAENLSFGGIRVRSGRALEPNTDVVLRFCLPAQSSEPIRAEGRVIHRHPNPEGDACHSLGIFFRSIEPRHREHLEAEVVRLMAGGDPATSSPARPS